MRYVFRCKSYTFTSFNWIYESLYKTDSSRKIIPYWIKDYINYEILVMWIMNDGSYIKNKGIKLSTNSFTLNLL
jgi:hypothetical protein